MRETAASIRRTVSAAALDALIAEVETTPKPGLVDLRDTGSHRDMDCETFRRSAVAVAPFLGEMADLGYGWDGGLPDLFAAIRPVGVRAERSMFAATGGVNTHKGAIFSLGILSAASGHCRKRCGRFLPEIILSLSGDMVREAMEADFAAMSQRVPVTHGEKLFARYGCRGIRGEAADGFPAIRDTALPVLREGLAAGRDKNRVYLQVLLSLMAAVEDTNILTRSDLETLRWSREQAAEFLRAGGAYHPDGLFRLEEMNRAFIAKNISPGGCADLLAGAIFLHALEESALSSPEGESVLY